jgi:NADH-quinone oxidoreductase subunit N
VFTATALRSILPEILILILAVLILCIEPFMKPQRGRILGWVTAGGLILITVAAIVTGRPGDPITTLGSTVRFDWLAFVFKLLFIFAAAITALFLMDHEKVGHRGEAYVLMLASTIGMCLMAEAADLIMLYLAIETTSIPLYILAGFMVADDRSTEAGFKYLLFGAMTSAIMLYGFSLLYGFGGSTSLFDLGAKLNSGGVSITAILGVIFLVIVGLGFTDSCGRLPFNSVKGSWFCCADALVCCGIPRLI